MNDKPTAVAGKVFITAVAWGAAMLVSQLPEILFQEITGCLP